MEVHSCDGVHVCRYSAAQTPVLNGGVSPAVGGTGTAINVTGTSLSGTVSIRFLQWQQQGALTQAGAVGTCSVAAADAGWASCALAPSLPMGQYSLVLEQANGALSVDPRKVRQQWAFGQGSCWRVSVHSGMLAPALSNSVLTG
jgi:hypothetical protein